MDDVFAMSQKVPLTTANFVARILPPIVCLYVMGVLVQLKGTRFYRFALLPVLVWFAWRGMFVDMSGGDPKGVQSNTALIVSGPGLVLHAIDVTHHRLIWLPSPCGQWCGLLHGSLFVVRVLRAKTNTTIRIPRTSTRQCGMPGI